jgi:hypothetical protein
MERMNNERMPKQIVIARMEGNKEKTKTTERMD